MLADKKKAPSFGRFSVNWLRNNLVRHEAQISYAIALFLGAVVFHLIFSAPTFLQLFWGLDGPNDISQHVTGFYAFRNSPWTLPLLWTANLDSPEGLNIYFTDSIPIFALLFKLLAPFLSPDFHYFKLSLFLAYLLQPLCAVVLVRTLGYRSIAAAFFAAAFSLLLKWFLFRYSHVALSAQFVLILSLALYVKQCRAEGRGVMERPPTGLWLLLLLGAFLIHSYLLVMVFGIYMAAILDGRYALPSLKAGWFLRFLLIILPILCLAFAYSLLIGLDALKGVPPADGFGYFSLNLMGPFYGGNLLHLPASLGPSRGQVYEDQSYLGLGLIGIIAAAVLLEGKNIFKQLWQFRTLVVVLLCFVIFGLSSAVYFGVDRIYNYPPWLTKQIMASPLSQFRSSARFFWPVGYGLLFWGLAVILKKRWAVPFLACMLLLQWIDLPKPFLPRPTGYTGAFNSDYAAWDNLFQDKRALYLYPTYYCGGDLDLVGLPAVLIAARQGVISNTASVSRFVDNCAEKAALGLSDLLPGTVHLFTRPAEYYHVFQEHPDWCAIRAEMAVCIPYPLEKDRIFLATIDHLTLPTKPRFYFP
jgi:hypothetical protein